MTSEREDLFAYIAGTSLMAINGQGPYTNALRHVDRDLLSLNELSALLPCALLVEGSEDNERDTSVERIFLAAKLTVYLYFAPVQGAAVATQINSWLADVKVAMIGPDNTQHGKHCSLTRYNGFEELPQAGQPIIGLAVDFTCEYSHTWSQP